MKTKWLVIAILILSCVPALADDDYIIFAKSLTAKNYDKTLPSVPIEQWLTSNLPRDVKAVWSENATECGEQTGISEIDRVRDMPLCAEIELRKRDEVIGHIMLFVGTEKKGKMKDAGLYYGYFKQGKKTIDLNELRDIGKMKGCM